MPTATSKGGFSEPSEPFEGLLVRISDEVRGGVGGKMFLIPAHALPAFEFNPSDKAAFDAELNGQLVRVDYAVFAYDFVIQGSAGG